MEYKKIKEIGELNGTYKIILLNGVVLDNIIVNNTNQLKCIIDLIEGNLKNEWIEDHQ